MRDAAGACRDAGDSSARLWTASFSSTVASACSRLIPVAAWDKGLHTSAQHCVRVAEPAELVHLLFLQQMYEYVKFSV